jgi:Asp/Glu/hydantoin racemase
MARKKVAIVHTSFAVLDLVNNLFDELLPDVDRVHIVEHSILKDILKAGSITPDLMQRMLGYFFQAEATHADIVFSVCSTVGDVADVARKILSIPIVKIDEAMVMEALEKGQRIGVLATLPSTLNPTCRLVENIAFEEKKGVHINRGLVSGAFEELINGNTAIHDQMVQEKLRDLAVDSEVVILAQASMARAIDALSQDEIKIPVLSSPRRGVTHLKRVIEALP